MQRARMGGGRDRTRLSALSAPPASPASLAHSTFCQVRRCVCVRAVSIPSTAFLTLLLQATGQRRRHDPQSPLPPSCCAAPSLLTASSSPIRWAAQTTATGERVASPYPNLPLVLPHCILTAHATFAAHCAAPCVASVVTTLCSWAHRA